MSEPEFSARAEKISQSPAVKDFEYLLDHTAIMAALLDKQGRYIFANQQYCSFKNFSKEELIGRSVFNVISPKLLTKIRPRIEAALSGEFQKFELRLPVGDENARWFEATYAPYLHPNKSLTGFFAIIQDIHERKRSEEARARFEFAVNQGQEGFALHDEQGLFTYINPAQAEMYGYEPSEVVGKSWKLFYSEEQVQAIEEVHFPRLMAERKWHGELRGRRKNGEEFDAEVSLSLLTNADGKAGGLVCNCRDVTERKLEQAKMLQLQKMESLGQLTGGIAHDFNNILAVVLGNLELLKTLSPLDPEFLRCVEAAHRAANQGSSLTQRLLAFSRRQTLETKSTDLNKLVSSMHDLLQRTLGEPIEVRTELSADLWSCEVDASQLESALLNLALNARDALPNGGQLVLHTRNCASAEREDDDCDEDWVILSITDNGVGIPPEVRDRVFDPFFTTKSQGKGTGLGLSMVHGIVTQSGGSISVESELGGGTTFTLKLLRAVEASQDIPEAVTVEKTGPSDRVRVLLVEDNRSALRVFATMLGRIGCQVVESRSGSEALQILETDTDFELLLCDVMLAGGMSGPQLVGSLREKSLDMPVLYMSGFTGADVNIEGPLLSKPFTMAQLSEKIRTVLDGAP